jgi:tetratricopeptide (TPR) repeat protein
MGEVYAAYDPELDRKVALKILRASESGADGRSRARLLREAKAIAKLRHPNVVVVHEAGSVDERVFLAMEYVEGETVAAWLAGAKRPRQEILDVFVAAGRGLAAAHAAGLVHRDFKPQNVMVGNDGAVRVMDFGLAREIGAPDVEPSASAAADAATQRRDEPEQPLTRTGELLGTPLYMAPEQFKAQPTDARTDQFSFCVALYQALYGAHPFGGGKLGELMAAVTGGRVQPPPPKSAVPPWLRRVLVRGLSVEPSQRWDSVEALIGALSRDPARRRSRLLVAAAAAIALAGLGWGLRAPRRADSICRGGLARMADAWEVDTGAQTAGPRREATRAAFLKTGLSYAADLWERTARMLDKYATGWLGMYRDACEATHARGEQSTAVLDLRMTCLSERLQRVKALTDVFAQASTTVVENAVQAAAALPGLDRCADVPLLSAAVPPPEDPKTRAQIDVLKRDLAHVKALADSGQCGATVAAAHALTEEAERIGYQPLVGEVLAEVARRPCVGNEEMLASSRRAALLGLASRDMEVAAQGAILLGEYLGGTVSEVGRAREWLDVAAAILQGMSRPHPVLEAWRLEGLAMALQKAGDTSEALHADERALAMLEQAYGPEHPDVSINLSNTGLVLAGGRRFEEALTYYKRAEEVGTKAGGPQHINVGMALVNATESLNALGRYEEARVSSERALAIWRRAGSQPVYEAATLAGLGQALLGLGRAAEAISRLDRARILLGDDPSPYRHDVRFALARALWTRPERRPRAVALAREAEAGYRRLGSGAAQAAEVGAWLRAHHARPEVAAAP